MKALLQVNSSADQVQAQTEQAAKLRVKEMRSSNNYPRSRASVRLAAQ
jgi:hypothetical protein